MKGNASKHLKLVTSRLSRKSMGFGAVFPAAVEREAKKSGLVIGEVKSGRVIFRVCPFSAKK
jgi:hypothetical protein